MTWKWWTQMTLATSALGFVGYIGWRTRGLSGLLSFGVTLAVCIGLFAWKERKRARRLRFLRERIEECNRGLAPEHKVQLAPFPKNQSVSVMPERLDVSPDYTVTLSTELDGRP